MNDENISQETIQEIADSLDIDVHFIAQYQHLQSKVSALKIKFEAHKIARGKDYGFKGKN